MSVKLLLFCLTMMTVQRLSGQDSAMNDHMFPAAPVAKPFIDYDAKGFLVNGKRTFIVSAGIEYARVPAALWRDRLLKLKRAGFNTVEIYTFWNFHEPQEGKFDFSGDHDLDRFLKLVRELGMFCIARVGPYYCAEWDQGGYPLWLRFKPNLRVREPNDTFQKYTGLFFDRLLPIVSRNQINHGGSVIMVQLENEHILGWGTVMPNRYFTFLRDKALTAGIQVPYFFSGLHHDTDPVGDKANLDDPGRPNPWMSTEFWSVWFNQYGAAPGDADKYERLTRKIIARGGNGYNYYMAHGGSNFGYTNNDEDAASYDYGSAIGQAGDLRPLYFRMKRCAYFATSFPDVLGNSKTSVENDANGDTSIALTKRTSSRGSIYFADNHSSHPVILSESPSSLRGWKMNLSIPAGGIVPLLSDYPLTEKIAVSFSATPMLGCLRQGNTSTLVCYGEPGSEALLAFRSTSPVSVLRSGPGLAVAADQHSSTGIQIREKIRDGWLPQEYVFQSGGSTVRLLLMSTALADRTWFLESGGRQYVVCGSEYPTSFSVKDGRYQLQAETALNANADSLATEVHVYSASSDQTLFPQSSGHLPVGDTVLALSDWKRTNATAPAGTDFDDSKWLSTANPPQMGADGHSEPENWYRAGITVTENGVYKLECTGGDRGSFFVDGKLILTDSLYKGEFLLPLEAGKHLLSVYTAHDGRDKLPGYIGPLDSVNAKGLSGEVWLKRDTVRSAQITGWRFIRSAGASDVDRPVPDSAKQWSAYVAGEDAFDHQTGYGWFETKIQKPDRVVNRLELLFKSVDEDAIVFVGGKKLFSHKGWNQPFRVTVNVSPATPWPLTLDVFIENHSNEGGIDQPVTINQYGPDDQPVKGWRMLGGTPADAAGPVVGPSASGGAPQGPAYYSAHFKLTDTSAGNTWRVDPRGLDHGYIWVNGHNLGHYPEKIAAPGLYVPSAWLHKGDNDIRILDEAGAAPNSVAVRLEKNASRVSLRYEPAATKKSVLKSGHAK